MPSEAEVKKYAELGIGGAFLALGAYEFLGWADLYGSGQTTLSVWLLSTGPAPGGSVATQAAINVIPSALLLTVGAVILWHALSRG